MLKLNQSSCLVLFIFCISLSSCTQKSKDGRDVIAYVNKEPIYASDLNRDIAIKTRQNPLFKVTPEIQKEYLNTIIDKKLIIQDAVKKGLTRDEKFVDTIKTFWEQTLVRHFVDHKAKEFGAGLVAADEEIKSYYHHLRHRVTFKVFKSSDKKNINKFIEQVKRTEAPADLSWAWESIGPISYQDVTSDVLRQAFDLPVGELKVIERDKMFYLVMVENRTEVPLQPLEALWQSIQREILAAKEQEMLDLWLKNQRRRAKIKIKDAALRK